jgi:predicted pyridoxine 5'-phosphate oxidase superfamily flavin-nucleotide-binding protein
VLHIAAAPAAGDPALANLQARGEAGVLILDPATRRRMRVNGRAELLPEGGIAVHASEVYSNCPKYIQMRVPEAASPPGGAGPVAPGRAGSGAPAAAWHGRRWTQRQAQWIRRSDTFFVASRHAQAGADASHRGGRPGFVRVVDEQRLAFPDYAGNNLFQTLGNLTVDPCCGLLFVDFDGGATLQLTGRASIDWTEGRRPGFAGAERVIDFQVERVVELPHATPLRWRLVEPSPFNPA